MDQRLALKLGLIAVGGGLGSVLRYLVSGWGQRLSSGTFPWGTLIVNIAGCFFIGLLNALFSGPLLIRQEYRVAILVGVLGGFTTFSAFGWETVSLATDGGTARALLNVLLSVGLGLTAVWFGLRLGQKLFGL